MPIPSSITDLSKVASENSPAGTESAKGTIDDYLRAHASFIKQLFDQLLGPSVGLASAATVNIGFAASINIIINGSTTITAFDAASEGTLRWVVFNGAMTVRHNASAIVLPGAANITTAFGDAALFKCTGGSRWICLHYLRASGSGPVPASMTTDGYLSVGDWNSFNSRLTPAAAAAAYLALATGGNLKGDIVFDNGTGILTKNAAGVPTQVFKMQGNNVNFLIHAAAAFNFYNQATDGVVASINNAGDLVAKTGNFSSDERLKKRWRRRPADFLQRVAGLRKLGDFLWEKDGTPGIGGSAQELEAIWPEAVHTDERGFKSVNYGAAAFVIAVELTRAFFAFVARTNKRLAKLEGK